MVHVFGLQQGGVYPAGEHRRHAKLRQSFDVSAIGSMGPLTRPALMSFSFTAGAR